MSEVAIEFAVMILGGRLDSLRPSVPLRHALAGRPQPPPAHSLPARRSQSRHGHASASLTVVMGGERERPENYANPEGDHPVKAEIEATGARRRAHGSRL